MTMKNYQDLHEGNRFPIHHPDGRVEYLTAKEYLAVRGRFNAEHELATVPSPGAGSRRVSNPAGAPRPRD
ncbi:MAG: hypothetical protein P1V51_18650 [Deltaproteobacteria bacterium]|nr:hypothetical protein [Deltaproteobacteria bacterium]